MKEKFLDEHEIDYELFMNKESYCMGGNCKKSTMSDPKSFIIYIEETSKGERWRLGMKCIECGCTKSSFISKDDIQIIGPKNDNKHLI